MLGPDEINNRFGFHKASIEGPNATSDLHRDLRRRFVAFANVLDEALPDGRAKACAFTALQEASMWAHYATAENAPLVNE